MPQTVVLNASVSNNDDLAALTSRYPKLKRSSEHGATIHQTLEACLTLQEPDEAKLEACQAALNSTCTPNPHVSATTQQAIAEAYFAGLSMKAIAKRVGLHCTTVSRALSKAGMATRPTTLLTDNAVELVRRYYAEHNLTQTARHFSAGKSTLLAFMKAHDIPRRSRHERARPVAVSP